MKTKLLIATGMLISAVALGSNKMSSKPEGTIKNEASVNETTQPVFTWERISEEGLTGNSPYLIYSYLHENLEYPAEALKYNIQGTAVVAFTITASGEITNIKVINSLCPEIDEEITGALKNTGGMWQPALKNGNPVDMEKEIALVFQIDGFKNGSGRSLFQEQAKVLYHKGSKALITQNNPAKALKYFDKALKYLPNETTILHSRGMAKQLLNDIEGAQKDWSRVDVLAARIEKELPLTTENIIQNSNAK
jgi:TonB family protein